MAPPELHWQSFASPEADGALSGEIRHPEGSLPPLGMSARRIIAYRAMLAIEQPQAVINLGVGMPEVLPAAAQPACSGPALLCSGRAWRHARPLAVLGGPVPASAYHCQAWCARGCPMQSSCASGLPCLGLVLAEAHGRSVQGVASVVAAHAAKDIPHLLPLTLSTEVGVFGGTPAGGLCFGAAVNATTAVPCSTIIDFYQGGGIDMACLGMAEVSAAFCACVRGLWEGVQGMSCQLWPPSCICCAWATFLSESYMPFPFQ